MDQLRPQGLREWQIMQPIASNSSSQMRSSVTARRGFPMSTTKWTVRFSVLALISTFAFSSGGIASAASHADSQTYTACSTHDGVLVLEGEHGCPHGTFQVTIGATGPAGPSGPAGPKGATGAAGPTGIAGASGAKG